MKADKGLGVIGALIVRRVFRDVFGRSIQGLQGDASTGTGLLLRLLCRKPETLKP